MPVFWPALTPLGSIGALAFLVDKSSSNFADLGVAPVIETGGGVLGNEPQNLGEQVRLLGIEDEVFEEIRSERPPALKEKSRKYIRLAFSAEG